MMWVGEYGDEEGEEELGAHFRVPIAMDLVKDRHVERLHPRYWLGAARSLRYSAEVIIEHEQPYADILRNVAIGNLDRDNLKQWPNHAGAQLLYAYAFENLLKGIIIAKNPAIRNLDLWGATEEEEIRLSKERRKQGLSHWMTHDAKKLVRLAGVALPYDYGRLLWILEGKAVWSGKYPAAVSSPKGVGRGKAES
jgi:hypothetical protein